MPSDHKRQHQALLLPRYPYLPRTASESLYAAPLSQKVNDLCNNQRLFGNNNYLYESMLTE